ncbi:9346_t:CDS:1 [Ambispora leptoticha]|uniref:9346_t:CDS:1 n=1 Tax=Ambispora leptoticha TaxID=144679 RepID=A0A9N9AER6_9GLOM|nr:9346_t:CDS:1 [Ambispora leptoticha]
MNEFNDIKDITSPTRTDKGIEIEISTIKHIKPIYVHQQQTHNEEETIPTSHSTVIETTITEENIELKQLGQKNQKSPVYNTPQETTGELSIMPIINLLRQGIQRPQLLASNTSAEHSLTKDSVITPSLPPVITELSARIETTFDPTTQTTAADPSQVDVERGGGGDVTSDDSSNSSVVVDNRSPKKGFFRRHPIRAILIAIVLVLLLGALAILIIGKK